MKRTTIFLKCDQRERLREMAFLEDRSGAEIVREALDMFFEDFDTKHREAANVPMSKKSLSQNKRHKPD